MQNIFLGRDLLLKMKGVCPVNAKRTDKPWQNYQNKSSAQSCAIIKHLGLLVSYLPTDNCISSLSWRARAIINTHARIVSIILYIYSEMAQ